MVGSHVVKIHFIIGKVGQTVLVCLVIQILEGYIVQNSGLQILSWVHDNLLLAIVRKMNFLFDHRSFKDVLLRFIIFFVVWGILEPDIIVFLNERIKSVLNFILRSSWDSFTDFWPLATKLCIELNQLAILFVGPFFIFYSGVKFVNESLSYLLPCFCAKRLGKDLPVFANFFHESHDGFVLMRWPNFFVSSCLGKSTISMETLVFISVIHESSYGAPFLGMFLVKFEEKSVFLGSPCFDFSSFSTPILVLDLHLDKFAMRVLDWNDIVCLHISSIQIKLLFSFGVFN